MDDLATGARPRAMTLLDVLIMVLCCNGVGDEFDWWLSAFFFLPHFVFLALEFEVHGCERT